MIYRAPWDNPDPCDTEAGEDEFIRRDMAARDEAAVARQRRVFERLVAEHTAPECKREARLLNSGGCNARGREL